MQTKNVIYFLSHFGVSLDLKFILSYKCQIKRSMSHIKKMCWHFTFKMQPFMNRKYTHIL